MSMNLNCIFPNIRQREEVLGEIKSTPSLLCTFKLFYL